MEGIVCPSGRVRARIEAPIGATLRVRAGGPAFPIALASLLEGPQRRNDPTGMASSCRTITSSGSPSSARVDGMNPKLRGNDIPAGTSPANRNNPLSGS